MLHYIFLYNLISGMDIVSFFKKSIINYNLYIMKAKILLTTFMSLLFAGSFAQDRTTVNATSSEISDNLDLRAIASIFGDSRNLEDFEQRLNDPKAQISNLDLNNDDQVDYLRVIESIEGRTHLIVVQSVLGRDTFQDVATIEVEKDRNNQIQVQVVGDVYMYGQNYIYEPVYVHTPIIYTNFWVSDYHPYCSTWNWGYYPSYYAFWNPYPVFRYRHNIGLWINFSHQYNYVNYRRCNEAYTNYYSRRGNGYERQYPNRSFSYRNSGYTNRHELERTRESGRRDVAYGVGRNSGRTSEARGTERTSGRGDDMARGNSSTRSNDMNRSNSSTRTNSSTRNAPTTRNTEYTPSREATRGNTERNDNPRVSENRTVRETTRGNSERNEGVRTNESRPSPSPSQRSSENRSSRQNSGEQSSRQASSSRGSSNESSRSSGNSEQSSARGNSSGGRR
jgi:hypothetical protein